MNREELYELIAGDVRFADVSDVVDTMWPVLAQVWDEGRKAAAQTGILRPEPPNPYGAAIARGKR